MVIIKIKFEFHTNIQNKPTTFDKSVKNNDFKHKIIKFQNFNKKKIYINLISMSNLIN